MSVARVLKVPKTVFVTLGFGESRVDLDLRYWTADRDGSEAAVSSDTVLKSLEIFSRQQYLNSVLTTRTLNSQRCAH
ncbi:hypothetical protein C8N36_12310 [Pelagimonas varians]|uniref:Uncharacterized protein n=1 Tax=Pelagimonas varians TaxID=696760 RepID=A0A238L6J5_9RHOB|nr:hypothetical protein C8N36_12310 [Pelagimonas varians]SMX50002.1 hypothetical protein PEV8663_04444 [Pelagimonas varians]